MKIVKLLQQQTKRTKGLNEKGSAPFKLKLIILWGLFGITSISNSAVVYHPVYWWDYESYYSTPIEACRAAFPIWSSPELSGDNYAGAPVSGVYMAAASNCGYWHPDYYPTTYFTGTRQTVADCSVIGPDYISNESGQCVEITLEEDHKQPHEFCVADPIIVTTGNSFQTEVEYQSQTPFGLNFVRFYNSSSNAVDKAIGNKWQHGFNRAIKLVESQAQVARSNGQTFLFTLTDGDWVGDVDIPDTLVELFDEAGVRTGWEYRDTNDNIESFNASGQLLSITNRAGQSKTFVYDLVSVDGGDDNSDTLDKVVGFGGEAMLFSYDDSQRITAMTDPEGNSYSYNYDAVGNLSKVTYPDNTPLDSLDNPTRVYHYENTAFPSHLTGLTDETGSRVTWAFDEEGRAISSELDSGVDKSTLDFSVADQVTVTNPLGKNTTYHFTNLHGVKKVVQVEGHETESCAGANQNYTYDANGYIESKTDWQGNVTTYVHNERGLETSRVEAFGTIEARTITTEWHDDFRLPKKITSPGQITDFVYDEKGRLLSQTTHDIQP
jgi:YD repeat-containing protein